MSLVIFCRSLCHVSAVFRAGGQLLLSVCSCVQTTELLCCYGCRLEAVRVENRAGLKNIGLTLMAKGAWF